MIGPWRFWPRRRSRAGGAASSVAEAGYNLVVLAVAITVLNILAAKALPMWSHLIQRGKEDELIFRGLQYAEAIRIFEARAQRLPMRLEELIEVKPRCIRKLWENPMTEDGSWGLIFQDQPGQPGQPPDRRRRRQTPERQAQQRFGVPGDGEEVRVGPIIGVYSPKGGEAIKVFAPLGGGGGTDISEWRFTRDLLQGLAAQSVAVAGNALRVPSMNAANIGRPWPPGINLPQLQRGRGVGVKPDRPSGATPPTKPPGTPPPQGRDLGGRAGRGGG